MTAEHHIKLLKAKSLLLEFTEVLLTDILTILGKVNSASPILDPCYLLVKTIKQLLIPLPVDTVNKYEALLRKSSYV